MARVATIYPFTKSLRARSEPSLDLGELPTSPSVRDALVADSLYERLISRRETFWSVVYPLFMARDITRATVRNVVQRGLADAGGSYQQVVRRFNLPPRDYRRFLNFLTKYELDIVQS